MRDRDRYHPLWEMWCLSPFITFCSFLLRMYRTTQVPLLTLMPESLTKQFIM